MENLKETGKLIGSLVVGALAGAALGVLFAPRKGTKTRDNIAKGAKKMSKDVKKKVRAEAKSFGKSLSNEVQLLKDKAANLEGLVEHKLASATASLKEKAADLVHINSDNHLKHK